MEGKGWREGEMEGNGIEVRMDAEKGWGKGMDGRVDGGKSEWRQEGIEGRRDEKKKGRRKEGMEGRRDQRKNGWREEGMEGDVNSYVANVLWNFPLDGRRCEMFEYQSPAIGQHI